MFISAITYGVTVLSLYYLDYLLGHSFFDMVKCTMCWILCFVRRTVAEKERIIEKIPEVPVTLPVLTMEVILLIFTSFLLKKYKQFRINGRIDDLLKESKDTLKQSNEYLDKWNLKRINNTYVLDDEVEKNLEVPILQMAIIDSPSRHRLDKGDTGDMVFIEDTSLSVSSNISDDSEVMGDTMTGENNAENIKNKFYLWDVMEEDSIIFEDNCCDQFGTTEIHV